MIDSAHGEYFIEVKDGIIWLTLKGEFNVESVNAYDKEIKTLVKGMQNTGFLMLINNLNLIGATPEAYQESNKHNEWLAGQNLIGKATVYPSDFLKTIDSKMVPSKNKINHEVFHTIEQAKHWLDSLK